MEVSLCFQLYVPVSSYVAVSHYGFRLWFLLNNMWKFPTMFLAIGSCYLKCGSFSMGFQPQVIISINVFSCVFRLCFLLVHMWKFLIVFLALGLSNFIYESFSLFFLHFGSCKLKCGILSLCYQP